MKVVVKSFVVRNKNFVLIRHDAGMYCAIEDKYLDDNGCLTQQLNGLQMHAGRTLEECMNFTRDYAEVEYLVEQGYSRAEAFCKYWNMMDKLVDVQIALGND